VELTREVARRSITSTGGSRVTNSWRRSHQENGQKKRQAVSRAGVRLIWSRVTVRLGDGACAAERQKNIALGERKGCSAFWKAEARSFSRAPGYVDPRAQDARARRPQDVKSYDNVISLRDRRRRWKRSSAPCYRPGARASSRPGNPDKCRCGIFNLVYSTRKRRTGCKTAAVRRKLAALNANSPSLMPCGRNGNDAERAAEFSRDPLR